MPTRLSFRLLLALLAACLLSCGTGSGSGTPIPNESDTAMPRPITRRERPYRDPRTNEPELTLVLSVQANGRTRFVLGQAPMGGGEMIVVADSGGAIPVFESEQEAEAYAARVFPLDRTSVDSADAAVGAFAELLAATAPTHIDFDAVRAWTASPTTSAVGPAELAVAWEVLAGADAAPAIAPFDPMSLVGLQEDLSRAGTDSAEIATIMTGMKLSGAASEVRRRGDPTGGPSKWPAGSDEFFGDDDRARLARILAPGIANFVRRLSSEAATRDVTSTWPGPR
jgi:hypothetical protein